MVHLINKLSLLVCFGTCHSVIAQSQGNTTCSIDQSQSPGDLTQCGNATLFNIWRPKAHFIAPEGFQNDPQGIWQRDDGSFHVGYQCHPQHIQWGNISMCAATSSDLVTWQDVNSWQNPKTLYPSEIYDIRGVFDGTIIKNGWNGFPTQLYTSTYTTPLGATVQEVEGSETQSLAWTEDGGLSWTKLKFGAGGNPVIYSWPEQNLTGFRDPYILESPYFASLLGDGGSPLFATISGGVKGQGPKLYLYRQAAVGNLLQWNYLGVLFERPINSSFSDYSGNVGINFETAAFVRLPSENSSDEEAINLVMMGTEQGRIDHQNHWPLYSLVNVTSTSTSISSTILASGVIDWGESYAFTAWNASNGRTLAVGWTYDDDPNLNLSKPMGYNGALTLFRELYVKQVDNVNPQQAGLNDPGYWIVVNQTDGTTSVKMLGQRIESAALTAFQNASTVSQLSTSNISAGYTPFDTQPASRHHVISAKMEVGIGSNTSVGFRILASASQEYTDIMVSPTGNVTVDRTHSSLLTNFNTLEDFALLQLWQLENATTHQVNMTIVVDNSIVEVHVNDEAIITTRVYPWLSSSTEAGILISGSSSDLNMTSLELWDGLLNVWPSRPSNTSQGLVWDGPFAAITGLWAGY